MTIEQYKGLIAEAGDADKAPLALAAILENLTTDINELETAKKSLEEKDGKIADLRDTNMKLFLRQTGGIDPNAQTDDEPAEKSPDELLAQFIKDISTPDEKEDTTK